MPPTQDTGQCDWWRLLLCQIAIQTKIRIMGKFSAVGVGMPSAREPVQVWGIRLVYPFTSNLNNYISQAISYSYLLSFLPQPCEVGRKWSSPLIHEKTEPRSHSIWLSFTQLPNDGETSRAGIRVRQVGHSPWAQRLRRCQKHAVIKINNILMQYFFKKINVKNLWANMKF